MKLAVLVVDEAARNTEAECRQIVAAAEFQAASLVREAQEDVSHITNWLAAGMAGDSPVDYEPRPIPISPDAKSPAPPIAEAPRVGLHANEMVDPAGPVGTDFFDSFHDPDEDRWSFMFDDELVGVGPALRRVLRRPSAPRPPRIAP